MKNKGMPTFSAAGLPTCIRPELWREMPEKGGALRWSVNSEWGSELFYGHKHDVLIIKLRLLVTKVTGKHLS